MLLHAYAKINLTLDIVGKRPDGYHELTMIMQSVGLYDAVSVKLAHDERIYVTSTSALLSDDANNTAYKAAKAFFEYNGIEGKGAVIRIEKNIPMEAGMAGGSADAAAVIVALDRLCGTALSDERLWKIGEKVGADVPFCITGGTMLARGKGEILTRLPQLSDFAEQPVILLCKPDEGVSTGRAYSAVDNCDPSVLNRPDTKSMCKALADGNAERVAANLSNVFEQVLRISSCESIKETMIACGAMGACMTGSGTTVFGLFRDKDAASFAADSLRCSYRNVFIVIAESCGCKIVQE